MAASFGSAGVPGAAQFTAQQLMAAGGMNPNYFKQHGQALFPGLPSQPAGIPQAAARARQDLAGPPDSDRFSGGQAGSDWNFGGPGYQPPDSMMQAGQLRSPPFQAMPRQQSIPLPSTASPWYHSSPTAPSLNFAPSVGPPRVKPYYFPGSNQPTPPMPEAVSGIPGAVRQPGSVLPRTHAAAYDPNQMPHLPTAPLQPGHMTTDQIDPFHPPRMAMRGPGGFIDTEGNTWIQNRRFGSSLPPGHQFDPAMGGQAIPMNPQERERSQQMAGAPGAAAPWGPIMSGTHALPPVAPPSMSPSDMAAANATANANLAAKGYVNVPGAGWMPGNSPRLTSPGAQPAIPAATQAATPAATQPAVPGVPSPAAGQKMFADASKAYADQNYWRQQALRQGWGASGGYDPNTGAPVGPVHSANPANDWAIRQNIHRHNGPTSVPMRPDVAAMFGQQESGVPSGVPRPAAAPAPFPLGPAGQLAALGGVDAEENRRKRQVANSFGPAMPAMAGGGVAPLGQYGPSVVSQTPLYGPAQGIPRPTALVGEQGPETMTVSPGAGIPGSTARMSTSPQASGPGVSGIPGAAATTTAAPMTAPTAAAVPGMTDFYNQTNAATQQHYADVAAARQQRAQEAQQNAWMGSMTPQERMHWQTVQQAQQTEKDKLAMEQRRWDASEKNAQGRFDLGYKQSENQMTQAAAHNKALLDIERMKQEATQRQLEGKYDTLTPQTVLAAHLGIDEKIQPGPLNVAAHQRVDDAWAAQNVKRGIPTPAKATGAATPAPAPLVTSPEDAESERIQREGALDVAAANGREVDFATHWRSLPGHENDTAEQIRAAITARVAKLKQKNETPIQTEQRAYAESVHGAGAIPQRGVGAMPGTPPPTSFWEEFLDAMAAGMQD